MLRTIIWFIYFALYQVWSIFLLIKYKRLIKKGKTEQASDYLYITVSKWARRMVKATGSTVTIYGLENIPEKETVLFVGNHQGNFDIPLLLGYLPCPVGFVAKTELISFPIVSTWMKLIKCIFIDRDNPRQSMKEIIKGISYLKEGNSMVIFPEGTRSKSDNIGEFKLGSMKMAIKSKVKIVPITIKGSYKLLEEKRRIKKTKVELIIHKPVDINNMTKDEIKNINNYVKDIIKTSLT
ncbi:MAG: lysophospholipid acyltransferase family protein [Eubacteriales bacterium]